MAAVLAAGPAALLSHRSAAAAWGMLKAGPRIEVIRPRSGNFKPTGFHLRQTRTLQPDQYTSRNGIPLTSVPRTLADLSRTESIRTVENAIAQADMLNLLRLDDLNSLLACRYGNRGIRNLRTAIERHTVLAHSTNDAERLFLALIAEAGLPAPETQVDVMGFRVDFAWLDRGVLAELDGWRHHGTRKAFHADRVRDRTLTRSGYRVFRFTWRDLTHDRDAIIAELREALLTRQRGRQASSSGTPPSIRHAKTGHTQHKT